MLRDYWRYDGLGLLELVRKGARSVVSLQRSPSAFFQRHAILITPMLAAGGRGRCDRTFHVSRISRGADHEQR